MVDDLIRQRIKFLIEHGDVAGGPTTASKKVVIVCSCVLGGLQLATLAWVLLHN